MTSSQLLDESEFQDLIFEDSLKELDSIGHKLDESFAALKN